MAAYIISSDDIKKELPGYDPNDAGALHEESTRIADERLTQAIRTRSEKTVILMSGGSASGKSEYVSAYLKNRAVIISDGTSSKYERANRKITQVLESGKKVEMHAVWPMDLEKAFVAFLNRDRKFSAKHFFRTHSSSRKTLLHIAQNSPTIPITVFFSRYQGEGHTMDTIFAKVLIENRGQLVAFLNNNQYTEEEIKRMQGIYDV